MSINSLANSAAARRTDMAPQGTVPQGLEGIAAAAATPPTPVTTPGATPPPKQPSAQVDTTLNVLFGYIPTEVLTLYVAVLAAIKPTNGATNTQNAVANMPTTGQWNAFWAFLIATPIVVWLVYGAKVKASQKSLPIAYSAWPVWEMFAATLAYCVWAFALPGSPFAQYTSWYSAALSSVLVLIVSAALGLLAPFFQRSLNVGD